MSDYSDRIRAGRVDPLVVDSFGPAVGARRSAAVIADELATLADDDERRPELEAQRQAWLDRAVDLER